MATKVQADTDLGNGWSAADLLDSIQVHGLEHTLTEFNMGQLDNIPKLHNALVSAQSALVTLHNTMDSLGFNELETEDF